MTHASWLSVLGCAIVVALPGTAARSHGAAADGPAIVTQVDRTDPRGGDWVSVYVTVASADPTLSGVIDPIGVASDGFVRRLGDSSFSVCHIGGAGCEPCPQGQRCFYSNILILDVKLAGDVAVPVTFTDGSGRSFQGQARFRVAPALDTNGDGMPNLWEERFYLNPAFYPDSLPGDDADGDGVTNLEEYRRGTNPRGRYVRYFAEASSGDRTPGLEQCFQLGRLSLPVGGERTIGRAWVTLIGDDGRRLVTDTFLYNFLRAECPLYRSLHPADRVVAAIVESPEPFAVERLAIPADVRSFEYSFIGSAGVEAPSTRWYFADGGADGETDAFYLAYNPGPDPVEATVTYRRDDGRVLLRRGWTLEPGRRTTTWVNVDDAAVGRAPAFAEIASSAPILVERAWRFNPPGRTVTQASASPGVATPSARWIFPEVDGGSDVETTIVVANPSTREATVDVSLLYDNRDEQRPGAIVVPAGGRATIPARLLAGLSGTRASMELVSRNGIGVVAERTRVGRDGKGPWRMAMAGAPQPGAEWTIAAMNHASSLVFTNVSTEPATLDVISEITDSYADDRIRVSVTVPPRRRVTFNWPGRPDEPRDPATPNLNGGTVRVERPAAERARADVVVEMIRRGRPDGASREPASGSLAVRVR